MAAFDAYHKWLGIPPEEQPPDFYRLLGVKRFEPDAEVVANAADRQMAHVRSQQSGQHAGQSQRLLNELSAARHCLLSTEKKAAYDSGLKARLRGTKPQATSPTAAKPVLVARPLTMQPQPEQPADAVNSELLSLGEAPRRRQARRAGLGPAVWGGAAAVVLVALGLTWTLLSGGNVPDKGNAAAKISADEVVAATAPDPPSQNPVASPATLEPGPAVTATDAPPPSTVPSTLDHTSPKEPVDTGAEPPDQAAQLPAPRENQVLTPTKVLAPESARARVPSAEDCAAATAEIRNLFHDDLAAAKKPGSKAALAERMLQLARDSAQPTEQYALFSEARDLAIDAGNSLLALEVIHAIAAKFDVDRLALGLAAMEMLGEMGMPIVSRREMVRSVQSLVDEAQFEKRLAVAERLAAIGISMARATKQNDELKAFARQAKEFAVSAKLAATAEQAREQLAADPEDKQARLALARYLCSAGDDWAEGVEQLRHVADATLSEAAEADATGAQSDAAALQIGNLWYEAAERSPPEDKPWLAERTCYWYSRAVGQTAGLEKAKVEKRLEELKALTVANRKPLGKTATPAEAASMPKKPTKAVTADAVVLWNMHDGKWADRGTNTCDIELRRGGKVVWTQKNIAVAWSATEDPATEISLPREPFDTVRVIITAWVKWGRGLSEIEVRRGRKNIAAGKPVVASSERGDFKAANVVDGIKTSDGPNGFWWSEDHQAAWVEIVVAADAQAKR